MAGRGGRLRRPQPFGRSQRGLEFLHQAGAKLRVAVEAERMGKAVRRGGRDRRGLREFVDPHRRGAKDVRVDEVGHLPLRRRQRRQRRGDTLLDADRAGSRRCRARRIPLSRLLAHHLHDSARPSANASRAALQAILHRRSEMEKDLSKGSDRRGQWAPRAGGCGATSSAEGVQANSFQPRAFPERRAHCSTHARPGKDARRRTSATANAVGLFQATRVPEETRDTADRVGVTGRTAGAQRKMG